MRLVVAVVVLSVLLGGCFGPPASRACQPGDPSPECQPLDAAPPPPRPDPACPQVSAHGATATASPRAFFRQDAAAAAAQLAEAFGHRLGDVQRGPEDEGSGTTWQIWFATHPESAVNGFVTAFWGDQIVSMQFQGHMLDEATAAARTLSLLGAGVVTHQGDEGFALVQQTVIGDLWVGSSSKFGVDFGQSFDLQSFTPVPLDTAQDAASGYLGCAEPQWHDAYLEATKPVVHGSSLAYLVEFRRPCANRLVTVDAASGSVIGHADGGLWCG